MGAGASADRPTTETMKSQPGPATRRMATHSLSRIAQTILGEGPKVVDTSCASDATKTPDDVHR